MVPRTGDYKFVQFDSDIGAANGNLFLFATLWVAGMMGSGGGVEIAGS